MRRRGAFLSRTLFVTVLLCAAAPLRLAAQAPAPSSDADWLQQASALIAHGKIDDAAAGARQRPADDPAARLVLARIALRQARYADAEQLLKPAVEQDAAGDAALELAWLFRATGRDEAAAPLFEAVADSVGTAQNAPALLRAARATAALGEFRQANQLFRRASRAGGGDPAVETAWGELFLAKHNTQDAARSFEEALKADPQWAPALLGRARALADTNPAAALESLGRAQAIDPDRKSVV